MVLFFILEDSMHYFLYITQLAENGNGFVIKKMYFKDVF